MDYSELEGKEIEIRTAEERTYSGMVTGIEDGVGITIQEIGTNRYLECIRFRGVKGCTVPEEETQKLFNEMVKQIETGYVDMPAALENVGRPPARSIMQLASSRTCAFT